MMPITMGARMIVEKLMLKHKVCTHKPVELDAVLKKVRKDVDARLASYVVQPKYDGCHMIAVVEGRDIELVTLFSRTGEEVKSLDHIRQALATFPHVANGVYIGEAWEEGECFDTINGNFRRKSAQAPGMQFVIFDYLTLEEYASGRSDVGYAERVKRMPQMMHNIVDETTDVPMSGKLTAKVERPPIRMAWSEGVAGKLDGTALQWAQTYKDSHGPYDGIILRDPYGTWTCGTGKTGEIIKVKPRPDFDLVVTDVRSETGEKTGRDVYSIEVELPNGKRQFVGSGVPHKFSEVPTIGDIVQVSCMKLTKNGLMREPVYERLRDDK
ncbi:ATP-dependent DNA ligase [Xanthomonas phage SB3]|uniref:ATP-dependent DNA ligase n=1 Tax=Xanthomonas phage SB3 TaxID=3117472 RepID=A0ABZ2GY28_9CAUD